MTTEKKTPRPASFENVGRRVDEQIEHLIAYLNDEVVPAVRNHSSRAVRIAAEKLVKFADYLDEQKRSS